MQSDYVVVGTGSAGSVVASRLSADSRNQVVVLEAGPMDDDKFVHIPAAFSKLFRGPLDWDYLTEPQKEVGGREIYWPRGKVLGGSSSMNAMMWVPGFPADYDEWGQHAGEQWDYEHLRTYRDRAENGALVISEQRSPRASTSARTESMVRDRCLPRKLGMAQNPQLRVQMLPRIRKVAVPALQHSPRFGQRALPHTV
jgi:choline dehydrogenase-like flavoprotein